jgi:lipopolysaccharide transport system ATP-binding protein
VDEVLAVGDAAFQKKCLGKMGDVAEKEGRTVLFVSHNMGTILNICPKAVLLVNGQKMMDGESSQVINKYLKSGQENTGEVIWKDWNTAPGNNKVRLHAVRIVSSDMVTSNIEIQEDLYIEIEFWNFEPNLKIWTSIHLLDKMSVCVLASMNAHSANLVVDQWFGKSYPTGLYRTICKLPGNFLNEGMYSINAFILSNSLNLSSPISIEVRVDEVISFNVHDTGEMRKEYTGGWIGVVRPKLAWQTNFLDPLQIVNFVEMI